LNEVVAEVALQLIMYRPTRIRACDAFNSNVASLKPVHTSNNVEATGYKVASCFDNVAGVDRALLDSSKDSLIR